MLVLENSKLSTRNRQCTNFGWRVYLYIFTFSNKWNSPRWDHDWVKTLMKNRL